MVVDKNNIGVRLWKSHGLGTIIHNYWSKCANQILCCNQRPWWKRNLLDHSSNLRTLQQWYFGQFGVVVDQPNNRVRLCAGCPFGLVVHNFKHRNNVHGLLFSIKRWILLPIVVLRKVCRKWPEYLQTRIQQQTSSLQHNSISATLFIAGHLKYLEGGDMDWWRISRTHARV